MRTNKEKYDFYYNKIKEIEQKWIRENLGKKPGEVYFIWPVGRIDTYVVDNIGYSNPLWAEDKPTRKDVEKAKEYFENMPKINLGGVRLCLTCKGESSTTRCTIKLDDIGKGYYGNLKDANKALKRLQVEKETEKHLLENGYVKCAYCGKIVKESDAVEHEITFRSRDAFGPCVGRKKNKYCPSGCAGYDQMAHEG
jgi:hypothetical protein